MGYNNNGLRGYSNSNSNSNPTNDTKNLKQSKVETKKHQRHPVFESDYALRVYAIFFLFMLVRRYWILHGVILLTLAHIGEILFSWFLHVKDAREIKQFKSWLFWWTKIGLDFATSTVEGDLIHRVLVANTLNFWNAIGKNYTINWFDNIANKGRTEVLDRTKAQIEQSKMNKKRFAANGID
uniref:Uncharacterized protein n=1 Tax=Pseudo-nitzschia australis TaxID=44445 RepID=A0A7S4A970_9STRA|mmetsp:Transcript_2551/g.5548  ORF Transcript_2551/g.5548 Transcript_2551/m.5548 type:complete len:182 (+) Transcript_2551:79-624(+)